jgi:hypothetical protein
MRIYDIKSWKALIVHGRNDIYRLTFPLNCLLKKNCTTEQIKYYPNGYGRILFF